MKAIRKSMFFAALAGAVMFTSCSVNDDIQDRGNNAVRFTAGIVKPAIPLAASYTRATGTTWVPNDNIGIFMMQSETAIEVNKQYKILDNSTGALNPEEGQEMYYPMDGSEVSFIAYYPYKTGATLDTDIDITIDNQNDQPAFDLLYSNNEETGSKATTAPVNLEFYHKLAKIVMNTTKDVSIDEDLAEMTVTIRGMYTQNSFNLKTGELGNATITADITPRTLTDGSKYNAIILPGSYAAEAVTVAFTISTGETFTWTLPATNFIGGNEYTYTVTLKRTGVEVTGSIKPWISVDEGPVTAE